MATKMFVAALLLCAAAAASAVPTVVLRIHDAKPITHHGDITVSWIVTGEPVNPVTDWISCWWLPFKATYTEYANVTSNVGSTSFSVVNARAPFVVRFFRGDNVLAESEPILPEGSFPTQVRIVLVPDHSDQLQIMWTSNRTTNKERVRFGRSRDNLSHHAWADKHTTYTHKEINDKVGLPPIPIRDKAFDNISSRALRCGYGECYNDFTASMLFADPGQFHIATLKNLEEGKTYYFTVGEEGGYETEIRTFKSRVPTSRYHINLVYVADAGAGYSLERFSGSASDNFATFPPHGMNDGARQVWDAILADPEHEYDDMSIMNGDISYARGWPYVWELFHNETEPLFGRLPVMATYGNHEYDWGNNPFTPCNGGDSGGEAGIPTARRFNFASEMEPWFYATAGPGFFVALSSEHSINDQVTWLETVLPKVNRTETPWLVFFLHRPLHQSNTWFSKALQNDLQQGYSNLFRKYGVDIVLTGHAHYYERMCAVSENECTDNLGFRDVWEDFHHTRLVNSSCLANATRVAVGSIDECRSRCMRSSTCHAIMYDHEGEKVNRRQGRAFANSTHCDLVDCQPNYRQLEPHYATTVASLKRVPGRSPIYVLDGTAGGVHVPSHTPYSPLTVYKDFDQWGYSRLKLTRESLRWTHYHINGSIVDQFDLTPVNAVAP